MATRKNKTQFISLQHENGSVTIVEFVTEQLPMPDPDRPGKILPGWKRPASAKEINLEIARGPYNAESPVVSWRLITAKERPDAKYRLYRNALRDDGSFHFDLDAAKMIHRQRLDQAADKLARIGADPALREKVSKRVGVIKTDIDGVETIDELLAMWPDGLPTE